MHEFWELYSVSVLYTEQFLDEAKEHKLGEEDGMDKVGREGLA